MAMRSCSWCGVMRSIRSERMNRRFCVYFQTRLPMIANAINTGSVVSTTVAMRAHSNGRIESHPEIASAAAHMNVPARLNAVNRCSDIPDIPANGGEMCETPGTNLVYSSE